MTLAEFLRQTAAAQLGADASADDIDWLAAAAADLLMQYGVRSAVSAERYSDGMLDAMLQDMEAVQRICYAAADITIPAGGTVCIEAVSRKPHSFDFFGFYNKMVDGYGVMTTGSVLTLQNQTARLIHTVGYYGQNFNFGGQGSTVPLSAQTEYYYLNLIAGAADSEQPHDRLNEVVRLVLHELERVRKLIQTVEDMRDYWLYVEPPACHKRRKLFHPQPSARHEATVDLLVPHPDAPFLHAAGECILRCRDN